MHITPRSWGSPLLLFPCLLLVIQPLGIMVLKDLPCGLTSSITWAPPCSKPPADE